MMQKDKIKAIARAMKRGMSNRATQDKVKALYDWPDLVEVGLDLLCAAMNLYEEGYRLHQPMTIEVDTSKYSPEAIKDFTDKLDEILKSQSFLIASKAQNIANETAKEIFTQILYDFKDTAFADAVFEDLQALADDEWGIRINRSERGNYTVEDKDNE